MGCRPSPADPTRAAHRQQLLKHCSHTAPSHGLHPSIHPPGANCSSTGPPRLGGSSPQPPCSCGGSSPWLQLRPGACSCGGSPQAAASSRPQPPAPPGAPPPTGGQQRGDLLHGGPMGAGGQPAPPGASPCTARRGTAAVSLEHLLPPAALTLGAAGLLLTPCSSSFCCAAVFPPAYICSPRGANNIAYWLSSGKRRGPFGAIWSWLLSGLFSQTPSLQAPATKPLPRKSDRSVCSNYKAAVLWAVMILLQVQGRCRVALHFQKEEESLQPHWTSATCRIQATLPTFSYLPPMHTVGARLNKHIFENVYLNEE